MIINKGNILSPFDLDNLNIIIFNSRYCRNVCKKNKVKIAYLFKLSKSIIFATIKNNYNFFAKKIDNIFYFNYNLRLIYENILRKNRR